MGRMELIAKQRQEREARKKAAELAAKKRKVTGGVGGTKSRYSSGTGGLSAEEKAKQKATKESVKKQNKAKSNRRGTGVKNRTDQPKSTTKKSSKLKVTARSTMRAANVERFGEEAILALEKANKAAKSKTKPKTTPKKRLNPAYYKPDGTLRRKNRK